MQSVFCRQWKQILFKNKNMLSGAKNFCLDDACFSFKSLPRFGVQNLNLHYGTRKYSGKTNGNFHQHEQTSRRKGLMILTYISGAIGAVLVTAVAGREYQRLKFRARGIEPVKNRLLGRKPYAYRYRGYNLPQFVAIDVDSVHTFNTREDDIWVVTFPKAGTTWVQEIVYLINTDLDFEGAKEHVDDRFPFFEFLHPGMKAIAKMPSPRYIKSHLPLSLLPNDINKSKPKIVYVARNPKDTLVSYYHFSQKFLKIGENTFTGSFDDYCQIFIEDQGYYGPWWKHVREAWDRRHEDNILFVTYEELQADLRGCIVKLASFLGKTLSPLDVEAIAAHCSFEAMRNNSATNYEWFKDLDMADRDGHFMRKGKVGDWRNHLSAECVAKLDEMLASKCLPAGLTFQDGLEEAQDAV